MYSTLKSFFIVISLCCINPVFSQVVKKAIVNTDSNGYVVTIDTENLVNEKILLCYTYGIKKQDIILDSITVKSPKQKVVFTKKNKIIGVIYKLMLQSKPTEYVELSIDNGDRIGLELNEKAIANVKCLYSNRTIDFLDYQKKINSKTLTADQKIALGKSIIAKYPNSSLSLYLKIENKIAEKKPDDLASKYKYRDSFFSFINKNDKQLILMPNVYTLLYTYIRVLPLNNENYSKDLDILFDGMNCKTGTYGIFSKWIMSNLYYFDDENLEQTLEYFSKKYIDGVTCDVLTDQEKSGLKALISTNKVLPRLSKIPDFSMEDQNGQKFNLSNIYAQNELTYLVFFSPTCHHCMETVPLVKNYFDQFKAYFKDRKIQVVSVLNDSDESQWIKFITDNKLTDWINLKNTDDKKQYLVDFNAYSNPNFFLLDKDGKILLKSFNPNALVNIFNSHFVKK
ncbi:TlpA family protein disulfide reductase [Flavobacterium sp. WC2409]|uniref:TlpA family protein disulfide reductase n=1 Tax=Flavobacterium sp. WC2409 TaxID=3234139 RepID=A0AB39W8Q4_9FLAO